MFKVASSKLQVRSWGLWFLGFIGFTVLGFAVWGSGSKVRFSRIQGRDYFEAHASRLPIRAPALPPSVQFMVLSPCAFGLVTVD